MLLERITNSFVPIRKEVVGSSPVSAVIKGRGYVAYNHLLSVVNTELKKLSAPKVIRVLELGCGNGELFAYLWETIRRYFPSTTF
jgi:hypothetical protein